MLFAIANLAYSLVDAPKRLAQNGHMSIAHALSDLFAGRTQTEVTRLLAEDGFKVDQTKVSRWLRGTEPRLTELALIEHAFDKPKGWILARAGFADMPGVEPISSPAGAAAGEPSLAAEVAQLRRDLLALTAEVVALRTQVGPTPAQPAGRQAGQA